MNAARYWRSLCTALIAVTLLLVISPSAGAKIVFDKTLQHRFSIVPSLPSGATPKAASPATQGTSCTAGNSDCSSLAYHGGPVQHGEQNYLFFWTPSGHSPPASYVTGLQGWLTGVAAADHTPGNVFGVNQQYYDLSGPGGTKSFVPYAVTDGGTITDTHAYPLNGCTDKNGSTTLPVCLTDAQIQTELSHYVSTNHLPTGIDTQYFVITPQNVGTCFDGTSSECSYSAYCAYHYFFGSGSSQVVYADLPWLYQTSGCDANGAFNSGYANSNYIDSVVSVFSHELSETMTDPNVNAWYQDGGPDNEYEIGDKCAYVYGSGGYGSMSGLPNNGSGYFNTTLGTSDYLLQEEFDNRLNICSLTNTDTQPSATFVAASPVSPLAGSSSTLTVNVTDPAGISSVQWDFGDSSSATTTTTSTTHTYASVGEYTLTALITDNHGNEVVVTRSISVVNAPPPPTATFTPPSSSLSGQAATFDASASTDPDGTITSYAWSFGDGATTTTSSPTTAHTYATEGTYTATLTVTDNYGSTDAVSHFVVVSTGPTPTPTPTPTPPAQHVVPQASFTVPATAAAGQPLSFDGSASTDADATITSYAWNFGDGTGTTTSSPFVSHTYAAAGTYTTTLTATDSNGATATANQSTVVTAAAAAPPLPSNVFHVIRGKHNTRRGSIALTIALPGVGVLSARDGAAAAAASALLSTPFSQNAWPAALTPATARIKGSPAVFKGVTVTISRSGNVIIQIVPTKAGLTQLRAHRKLSIKVLLTFAPTGGTSSSLTDTRTLILAH